MNEHRRVAAQQELGKRHPVMTLHGGKLAALLGLLVGGFAVYRLGPSVGQTLGSWVAAIPWVGVIVVILAVLAAVAWRAVRWFQGY